MKCKGCDTKLLEHQKVYCSNDCQRKNVVKFRSKKPCPKCSRTISASNYNKHINTCDGTYFTGQNKPGEFSSIEWKKEDGFHCPECNKIYEKSQSIISHYWSKHTEEGRLFRKQQGEKRTHDPNIGYKDGSRKPVNGYSKRFEYNGVKLDSSYELKVAKSLDEHNITWSRGASFPWVDKNGKSHRYYPDFYLPDYGLYLDPKNKYLIVRDTDKINRVCEQNNIKVAILTESELCWEDIKLKFSLDL